MADRGTASKYTATVAPSSTPLPGPDKVVGVSSATAVLTTVSSGTTRGAVSKYSGASSTTTQSLTPDRAVGTSSATGTLTVTAGGTTRGFATKYAGVPNVVVAPTLAGISAGTSTATGTLSITSGTTTRGTGTKYTARGDLFPPTDLRGTSAGVGTATAAANVTLSISGQAAGSSAATASLGLGYSYTASSAGSAQVQGDLSITVGRYIEFGQASSSGVAQATASIIAYVFFVPVPSSATSQVTADLTVIVGRPVALDGQSAGTGSAFGNLQISVAAIATPPGSVIYGRINGSAQYEISMIANGVTYTLDNFGVAAVSGSSVTFQVTDKTTGAVTYLQDGVITSIDPAYSPYDGATAYYAITFPAPTPTLPVGNLLTANQARLESGNVTGWALVSDKRPPNPDAGSPVNRLGMQATTEQAHTGAWSMTQVTESRYTEFNFQMSLDVAPYNLDYGLRCYQVLVEGRGTAGGTRYWVPEGVTSLTIDVYGSRGEQVYGGNLAGSGGHIKAVIDVVPGEELRVFVPPLANDYYGIDGGFGAANITYGGGTGSFVTSNGGYGGGATEVRRYPYGLNDRLIVAGGGGGAGGGGTHAGQYGGHGGGDVGGTGLGGYFGATGGLGGSQTAGGAGGKGEFADASRDGGAGSFGCGGDADSHGGVSQGAGGGGGGWYGGGAGGWEGADGGGGSSHAVGTILVNEQGVWTTTPKVIFSVPSQPPSGPRYFRSDPMVAMAPGYTYEVSFWARAAAPSGGDITLWTYWYGATGQGLYNPSRTSPAGISQTWSPTQTGVWSQVTTLVTAPTSPVAALAGELYAETNGDMYLDDFYVKAVAAPAGQPVVIYVSVVPTDPPRGAASSNGLGNVIVFE